MVISQFDYEPLQYLTDSLLARYPISAAGQAALENRLQELRRNLFASLLVGHLGEIRRLLKPNGRAYVSFEVCHRKKESELWFIPDYVGVVLEQISRNFLCSFDVNPPAESMTPSETCEGESVVMSLLLAAA